MERIAEAGRRLADYTFGTVIVLAHMIITGARRS